MTDIRINGQRLWDSLMVMAEIGATQRGGCNRQALTDEDKQGRDLFATGAGRRLYYQRRRNGQYVCAPPGTQR